MWFFAILFSVFFCVFGCFIVVCCFMFFYNLMLKIYDFLMYLFVVFFGYFLAFLFVVFSVYLVVL